MPFLKLISITKIDIESQIFKYLEQNINIIIFSTNDERAERISLQLKILD